MPARIVISTYRYKRPPPKKPVLLEVPAIVTKRASRPQASPPKPLAPANNDRKPAIVTVSAKKRVARADGLATVASGSDVAPSGIDTPRSQPAAVAPRSAIVIAKRRRGRFGEAPDMTLEEHQRRGDAADTLFREIVRKATE